jgi:hypothetical protein
MLPTNIVQELLSRAYVHAVAAMAGVICSRPSEDFGLDLGLQEVVSRDRRYAFSGVQIDVQLKSTTRAEAKTTEIVYDLEVPVYDLLREVVSIPPILVLLVLPADEALWLEQSEEQLIVRHCSYWLSLRGADATTNQSTVRVHIPRSNVLSPQAIKDMMSRLNQRLPL